MSRDTFSIEHKIPWLDSSDPVGLYFDLNNISFSHHSCNVRAARRPNKKYFSEEEKREAKNNLEKNRWRNLSKEKQKAIRKEKYVRNGC